MNFGIAFAPLVPAYVVWAGLAVVVVVAALPCVLSPCC